MAPIEEIPFSFKGSGFRWKCKIEGPHAPHVVDHYNTVSYGSLQYFCLGQEGNGLHIHIDHYYGGSPSMAARASGTYWQGEPDPREDDIFEFTGRIWPTVTKHHPRVLFTDIHGPDGREIDHANLKVPDRHRPSKLPVVQNYLPDGTLVKFRARWGWHKSDGAWKQGPVEPNGYYVEGIEKAV